MTTYSHSRLATFEQCPLKFKFGYVDKLEGAWDTIEAFLGTCVHETFEKLYTNLKFQKTNTLEELLFFYNEQWKKGWNADIRIVRPEYTPENYRLMGEKFIRDYYKRCYPFNQGKTLGLEMRVELDLDGTGRYMLQGYIDRLSMVNGNVYEIHDYKTANTLPLQEEKDKDRQLALYALAVKRMYPDAKEIVLVWHFLAFDKEIRSARTDLELKELTRQVIEIIQKVEVEKEWAPKESALCDWCEYAPMCPRQKHKHQLLQLPSNKYLQDSGVKLVNVYHELNEQKKKIELELEQVKDVLFAFSRENKMDNIVGSSVTAKLRTYTNAKLPGKEDPQRAIVEEILKRSGTWDKFQELNTFELSKALQFGKVDLKVAAALKPFIELSSIRKVYLSEKYDK